MAIASYPDTGYDPDVIVYDVTIISIFYPDNIMDTGKYNGL